MKAIQNVENVYMDVNEFLNVKTIRENRCAINDLEEARADFYSEAQHKEFISRTKGYLKMPWMTSDDSLKLMTSREQNRLTYV